jgi:hypothetical protein
MRPETVYHIMYALPLPLSSGAIIIQHSRAGSRSQVGEDSGCARSGINSYGEKPGQKETQKRRGKKKKKKNPIGSLYPCTYIHMQGGYIHIHIHIQGS